MPPSPSSIAASRRRQRVHEAVRGLLAEQGFRVSMDAVAARVGCSKQTLYAQFGSKQELMRSVVQEHVDLTTTCLESTPSCLRGALVPFAVEFLQSRSDPSIVGTARLLRAEAARFPEEASALYRHGFQLLQGHLAEWLELAMQRGLLRTDPPEQAAELLLGMIAGLDFERQNFSVEYRDDDHKRRQWAQFAVDAFLQLYAPSAARPAAASPPFDSRPCSGATP